jgi:ketosteroid isomerase-like protein
MSTPVEALADRLVELFENVKPKQPDTVEALRIHYHPEIRFTDPVQSVQGLDAFVAANRRLVERARELSFDVHERAVAGDQIFLTWTMTLAMPLGPRLHEDGVTHIRTRDGLVVEQRDYWDIAALVSSAVPGGKRLLRVALKPFV